MLIFRISFAIFTDKIVILAEINKMKNCRKKGVFGIF